MSKNKNHITVKLTEFEAKTLSIAASDYYYTHSGDDRSKFAKEKAALAEALSKLHVVLQRSNEDKID